MPHDRGVDTSDDLNDNLTDSEYDALGGLLKGWLGRCDVSVRAYNRATDRAVLLDRLIGVPATVLSAVVATSVFANISQSPSVNLQIATGIVALTAAILAALQTFLRLAERGEQYRDAARRYGELRRRLELGLRTLPRKRHSAIEMASNLEAALNDAASGKPNVPARTWRWAKARKPR